MRRDTFDRYYEEGKIIPQRGKSESGTLMNVGLGVRELRIISLPRRWVVERSFAWLYHNAG